LRVPFNLFFRGQRDAAFEMAHQAEEAGKIESEASARAEEFYLAVENADKLPAGRSGFCNWNLIRRPRIRRWQLRHIALRLDEASEYARALAIDPKSRQRASAG
jgi:hypothetical protein